MPAVGVVVGPVDHAALFIPLVLAVKFYPVALGQIVDAGRQVDIVGHQQGLPRGEPDDEALVPPALVVVGQKGEDDARPLDLHIALPVLKRLRDQTVGGGLLDLGSVEMVKDTGVSKKMA
jgi:hypothetical protein